jgi:hypothetical protein
VAGVKQEFRDEMQTARLCWSLTKTPKGASPAVDFLGEGSHLPARVAGLSPRGKENRKMSVARLVRAPQAY